MRKERECVKEREGGEGVRKILDARTVEGLRFGGSKLGLRVWVTGFGVESAGLRV